MWKRDAYHNCAHELQQASDSFREAIARGDAPDSQGTTLELEQSSKDGVNLLKILALSVRPEQDFEILKEKETIVGKWLRKADPTEIQSYLTGCLQPPIELPEAQPLPLREALNKIAHANPNPENSSYAADHDYHQVILTGKQYGCHWIAVLDILRLCEAIRALPDRSIVSSVM
jgi:hypothetical protein